MRLKPKSGRYHRNQQDYHQKPEPKTDQWWNPAQGCIFFIFSLFLLVGWGYNMIY